LKKDLVEIIERATQDVMTTMVGFGVQCDRALSPEQLPDTGVLSTFTLDGAASGTAIVVCSPALACRITSLMLQTECNAVNADVLDAMGEIANMIVGNVKNVVEAEADAGRVTLSTPTVRVLGGALNQEGDTKSEFITVAFRYNQSSFLSVSFSSQDGVFQRV